MSNIINFIEKIFKRRKNPTPTIIPRQQHRISRAKISKAALKVLYRIHRAGYAAYLVGGSVRDLLLGQSPKDFDVVTDAHPDKIKKLFRNSYIIGRRFKLVHVHFGPEIIEVATFRSMSESKGDRLHSEQGMIVRDNVYGTFEEDVWRRDFTVNALYYNIADFSVVDYTGGMQDLEEKKIRVLGDATKRYREDPARMLRAIRLAAKLGFTIDDKTSAGIYENKELILQIPPARLFDKLLKIFHSGRSYETYQLLRQYHVFEIIFPYTEAFFDKNPLQESFLKHAFLNTDERVSSEKSINSAFLFAVLLWSAVQDSIRQSEDADEKPYLAYTAAIDHVLRQQLQIVTIPRRFTSVIREIWLLQYHFEHAKSRSIYRIYHHVRFRASYDFLLLRAKAGEDVADLSQWWTVFQESDENTQGDMIKKRYRKKKPKKISTQHE